LPISETSKIWKESEPVIKADGIVDIDSADYSVVAIGKSLNSVLYAIKKLPKNG
jgi:soluble P-type ATPase